MDSNTAFVMILYDNKKFILMFDPKYPKISIITPSYNQAEFLEETILSVLNQNYPNLEYMIIDGGSNDGSVEIIRKYEKYLTYWISEPDNGQYDAINKGFSRSTGDIMAWIVFAHSKVTHFAHSFLTYPYIVGFSYSYLIFSQLCSLLKLFPFIFRIRAL